MLDDDLVHYSPEDLTVSMEGVEIPYPTYYFRRGVRLFSQLANPRLNSIKDFYLTRSAISHYIPEQITDIGPDPLHMLVKDAETRILVEHIKQYVELEGPAVVIPRSPLELVRRYIKLNTKARPAPDAVIQKLMDSPRRLILENYAFLNHRYRWRPTPAANYYKFTAMFKTVYSNVQRLSEMGDRQHYFRFMLPTKLPKIADLRKYEKAAHLPPNDLIKRLGDIHSFWIADTWTWLGKFRDHSLLSKLPHATLEKMNFIFAEGSSWSILNVGNLDNWRVEHKNDPVDETKDEEGNRDTTIMQLMFLRYLTTLFECRNNATSTLAEVVVAAQNMTDDEIEKGEMTAVVVNEIVNDAEIIDSTLVDEEVIVAEDPDAIKAGKKIEKKISLDSLTKKKDLTKKQLQEFNEKTDKKINLVSEKSPNVVVSQMEVEMSSTDNLSPDDDTETDAIEQSIIEATLALPVHERKIMMKANQLASSGQISASQYRRIQKLSEVYKELDNPFGEGSFLDLATITEEDAKIPEPPKHKDDPRIADKSMLSTKLNTMNKKYSDELQYKHMAAMILNLQQSGFAISKYEVSEVKDMLNDYLVYSIKINPIEAGIPSTITFRIPRVQEDGTYVVNGVRNHIRLQRIDVPFRKVGPDKVYITSYYTKLVISKSEKVVNSFQKYLYSQLNLLMTAQDSHFKDIVYKNSFDNYLKVSDIYSKLSQRFESFTFKNDKLYFKHADRIEKLKFKPQDVEEWEKHLDAVLCGRRGNYPILITKEGEFVLVEYQGALNYLGDASDYFGLNVDKMPFELVEIKIAGEKVPLGFIIAYLTSFDYLLKLCGGEIRRIDTGERANLSEREYAIQFQDKTLVFDKSNRLAMHLLSGFAKAKSSTRQFPLSNFNNNKEVYYTLINETIGSARRIMKEALLMDDLFVDPITKDILESMGEPTELVPLLVRANELLETDWYPDENDPEYQRFRGYERFAGMAYKEILTAIKQFNNKKHMTRSKIELHPDIIYRAIDKDTSKNLIQESNPIHNCKEKEIFTFGGTGGRSNDTMMKKSRSYHEKDLGVVGEAVPDNKSVGLVSYLAADPNIVDMYGRMERLPDDQLTPSSLQTTASLVSAASDTDDKCLIFMILNNCPFTQ